MDHHEKNIFPLLQAERAWLAKQPSMNPWNEGCRQIVRLLEQFLRRYSDEVRDPPSSTGASDTDSEISSDTSSDTDHAYAERLWQCLSHHWRDAVRVADEKPGAAAPDSPSEVATRIASGLGYSGGGNLGGDPLRDVVLAVAMVRREDRAVRIFHEDYYPLTFALAAKMGPCLAQGRFDLADPEPWWNEFVDHLAGYSRPANDETNRPALDKFHGRCALKHWLRTLAYRFFQELLRRRKHRNEVHELDDHAGEPPVPGESIQLFSTIVNDAVSRLTNDERLVLQLNYVDGLPNKSVAATFGVHEGTASRRREKAEERLQSWIAEHASQKLSPAGFAGVLEDLHADKRLFSRILADALKEESTHVTADTDASRTARTMRNFQPESDTSLPDMPDIPHEGPTR